MDAARARELYRKKKGLTHSELGRVKGRMSYSAAAERRWRIIEEMSERGATLAEAAAEVGLTIHGVEHSCYRHTGSRCWPIKRGE